MMASKDFQKSQDDDSFGSSDNGDRSVNESIEDVYEGVEKKLTLKFSGAEHFSIRQMIKEKVWKNMVHAVDAEILSVMRNESIDAYLLSESSLFVFDDKVCLKTCGKTRIFNAVGVVVPKIAKGIPGINLTWVRYSRPTYRFPGRQLEGYDEGFESEVERLKAVTAEATGSSWNSAIHTTGIGITFHSSTLFQHEKHSESTGVDEMSEAKQGKLCMDLAMFNLCSAKMSCFFGHQKNVLEASCLRRFLPCDTSRLMIDDYSFKPCGYSLNALDGEYFWCVHVTPQEKYSYVSFETNHPSALTVHKKLIEFYVPSRSSVLWTDESRLNWFLCIDN